MSDETTTAVQQAPEKKVFFGVEVKKRFEFPGDSEQWVEMQKMNEGKRSQYDDMTARNVSVDRDDTKKMEMPISSGKERRALIILSVCKYRFYALNPNGETILVEGSDAGEFKKYYDKMDGDLANEMYNFCKDLNPFVNGISEEDQKK